MTSSSTEEGKFDWVMLDYVLIPCLYREEVEYCSLKVTEEILLHKYFNYFTDKMYDCFNIKSFYITEPESKLFHENAGLTSGDLIVRLSDVKLLLEFLQFWHKRLATDCRADFDKCGFVRIDGSPVHVPYIIMNGEKMLPLFCLSGMTSVPDTNVIVIDGWNWSYLRCCCILNGGHSLTDLPFLLCPCVALGDLINSCSVLICEFSWPCLDNHSQLLASGTIQAKRSRRWVRFPDPLPISVVRPVQSPDSQVVRRDDSAIKSTVASRARSSRLHPYTSERRQRSCTTQNCDQPVARVQPLSVRSATGEVNSPENAELPLLMEATSENVIPPIHWAITSNPSTSGNTSVFINPTHLPHFDMIYESVDDEAPTSQQPVAEDGLQPSVTAPHLVLKSPAGILNMSFITAARGSNSENNSPSYILNDRASISLLNQCTSAYILKVISPAELSFHEHLVEHFGRRIFHPPCGIYRFVGPYTAASPRPARTVYVKRDHNGMRIIDPPNRYGNDNSPEEDSD